MDYLSDPEQIYAQSFAIIKSEADLGRFSGDERDLAIRLIHSSGMIDIVDDLVISKGAIGAGRAALAAGAAVICDVNMLVYGIIRRKLPASNPLLCALDDQQAKPLAQKMATTRSAAGIELLRHELPGAIVAIGNAPTALFRLLEMLDQGLKKPALIIGFPPGFVGAAESKGQLIANLHGVPFIALEGRRGGTALAAAAVNALVSGLKT
ncbi:Cobalt-precorrin-8x methylmutase [hydrothermal vent metagenome]|uniref:Cobalt-precorrin-8x methylmutase n=1 Tax=hydrothermal vent metagenome TaxID=652676 RepID=A0A3B0TRW2_9ZZZZ